MITRNLDAVRLLLIGAAGIGALALAAPATSAQNSRSRPPGGGGGGGGGRGAAPSYSPPVRSAPSIGRADAGATSRSGSRNYSGTRDVTPRTGPGSVFDRYRHTQENHDAGHQPRNRSRFSGGFFGGYDPFFGGSPYVGYDYGGYGYGNGGYGPGYGGYGYGGYGYGGYGGYGYGYGGYPPLYPDTTVPYGYPPNLPPVSGPDGTSATRTYRVGERADRRDPGLKSAITAIKHVWGDGDPKALGDLVRRDAGVGVYRNDEFQFTLDSGDYIDQTTRILKRTTTVNFSLDDPRVTARNTVTVTGHRTYKDADGTEHTSNMRFVLVKTGDNYSLTEVGTTSP